MASDLLAHNGLSCRSISRSWCSHRAIRNTRILAKSEFMLERQWKCKNLELQKSYRRGASHYHWPLFQLYHLWQGMLEQIYSLLFAKMIICSEPASLIGCTFSSSICQTLRTHYYEYLFHFCRQYPLPTGRPIVKEKQIHSMGKAVALDYK